MIDSHNSDIHNIGLIDIQEFLRASKYYCLIGAIFGLLFSVIYLERIEPIFESKIIIEIGADFDTPSIRFNMSPEEIKERLSLLRTREEILEKINSERTTKELDALKQSAYSVKLTSSGKFIEISSTSNSANRTEAMLSKIGDEILLKISHWNQHRLNYISNQQKNFLNITQTPNGLLIKLQNSDLRVESPLPIETIKPKIIDGPTKSIQINAKPYFQTLIQGLLFGLCLALFVAFLRIQWNKSQKLP